MLSEQEIQRLESRVPELSAFAVNQAFLEARKEGLSVVVSDDSSNIVEIMPNGERRIIKQIAPQLKMAIGTTIQIP
jgi:hypothetical protein